MSATICLLADVADSMPAVADMRWREWGTPPEPEDPAWWLEITIAEAERERLPVTFVAVDDGGGTLGAVGLDSYDLPGSAPSTQWASTNAAAGRCSKCSRETAATG